MSDDPGLLRKQCTLLVDWGGYDYPDGMALYISDHCLTVVSDNGDFQRVTGISPYAGVKLADASRRMSEKREPVNTQHRKAGT